MNCELLSLLPEQYAKAWLEALIALETSNTHCALWTECSCGSQYADTIIEVHRDSNKASDSDIAQELSARNHTPYETITNAFEVHFTMGRYR